MKRFKVVLIIASSLLLVALIVLGLAFNSGVQTWAVRRALAGQPGLNLTLGSVSAGLSSAVVRDVRLEQDGNIVVVKELTAGFSATDYVFGKKINVGNVTVHGVEVDARKAVAKPASTPPAATAALAPFAGILNAIRLPAEVRLGHIDVEAKVLLPKDQSAQLTLEGGGIAPGEFGSIKWTVTFADTTKGAPLATAKAVGTIRVRTTADQRVDSLLVSADANATGPNLPRDSVKLEIKLEQAGAKAGETISADVSLVRGGATEKLLGVQAAYAAGSPVLNGSWTLGVRSAQFAAVLDALGLPDVALKGEGKFSFNVQTHAATTSGAVDAEISKLEKLGAELAVIGALQVHAGFDAGATDTAAQLGKLEFEIAAAGGKKFVTMAAQQKLSFDFKTQRITPEKPGAELARIALSGVPLAWAQPYLKPRTISGDLSGVFTVGAELDGSRVKLSTVEPLTLRAVTLREGDKLLVDRATVALSPRVDYTAARIVAEIEKLSVSTADGDRLGGGLSADVVTGAKSSTIAFAAQLQGRLAALVKPFLPAGVGALTLAVDTKGRLEGKSLQLAALKVQVDREGGAALAGVEVLQSLSVNLDTQKVAVANPATPAARVRWGEIPLAWAEPYVAKSKLAGQLVAGALEVTLSGADAVTLRAIDRIAAQGATVVMDGQELLRGADFGTDLTATWKAGTLTAEVNQLELKQGGVSLVSAAFAGDVTQGKTLRANGKGTVSADFAALGKQPSLSAQLPLIRGNVVMKFEGAVADGVTGKISFSAQNLVARAGALPLGAMELTVDAKLDANNSGQIRNALVVTKDGRKSDLLIDGKVGFKPGAVSFDGRITGDQLIVDDLQAFAAIGQPAPAAGPLTPATTAPTGTRPGAGGTTPAPKPSAPVAVAAKPTGIIKDTTPIWAGFAGRCDLAIKAIKLDGTNTVTDLKGVLSARDDRAAVEGFSLSFNGNPIKLASILTFDGKLPRPYSLVGSFDVPKFDVGDYLKRANPKVPPALETIFTTSAKFSGTAANMAEFADRLTGQFEFKGSKGILRALNKKAEVASAAAGLLGLVAGAYGQGKLADGLSGISELAAQFKDMTFESLFVQVERGADGVVVVKSVELLAPALHLTGKGRIESKPSVPFGTSPLMLEVQLAAKDQIANGLNKLRQLDGKTDAKGYYLMTTPFTMGGTVSEPDSSAFWKMLALNTAGAGLLR